MFAEPGDFFRALLLIISEASSFQRMAGCYQLQATERGVEERREAVCSSTAAAFALSLARALSFGGGSESGLPESGQDSLIELISRSALRSRSIIFRCANFTESPMNNSHNTICYYW